MTDREAMFWFGLVFGALFGGAVICALGTVGILHPNEARMWADGHCTGWCAHEDRQGVYDAESEPHCVCRDPVDLLKRIDVDAPSEVKP